MRIPTGHFFTTHGSLSKGPTPFVVYIGLCQTISGSNMKVRHAYFAAAPHLHAILFYVKPAIALNSHRKLTKVPHQAYAPNIDEDNPLYATDGFRMFCFKVLPCSKRFSHDWISCPFTHPAEKAKRRDPRAIAYTGIACPDMKRAVQCPRGDACTFAHNVFEYHMHPSR